MTDPATLQHLVNIYERMRDQQEIIADLTMLMTPLLKSLSESCPGFSEIYEKNSQVLQPKVIHAKRDSLDAINAEIEKLKAALDGF